MKFFVLSLLLSGAVAVPVDFTALEAAAAEEAQQDVAPVAEVGTPDQHLPSLDNADDAFEVASEPIPEAPETPAEAPASQETPVPDVEGPTNEAEIPQGHEPSVSTEVEDTVEELEGVDDVDDTVPTDALDDDARVEVEEEAKPAPVVQDNADESTAEQLAKQLTSGVDGTQPDELEHPNEQQEQTEQQTPVETVPTETGTAASVDGVTLTFVLRKTWAVPGGRLRGYTVSIKNGSDKDVCGVSFMPNSKTTELLNLSVADDGSLTTKSLHLAPGAEGNNFGYITIVRSLPTIIAVTYC